MNECCISDFELSFYARQSWKGIWDWFRDIFKLEFPILSLDEETDEEWVLLDWVLKQTSMLQQFSQLQYFCAFWTWKKWTEQLFNVQANVIFQILSYHFMPHRVEKVYDISLKVLLCWMLRVFIIVWVLLCWVSLLWMWLCWVTTMWV
jgi:hypothetical protein